MSTSTLDSFNNASGQKNSAPVTFTGFLYPILIILLLQLILVGKASGSCELVYEKIMSLPLIPDLTAETRIQISGNYIKAISCKKSSMISRLFAIGDDDCSIKIYNLVKRTTITINTVSETYTNQKMTYNMYYSDPILNAVDEIVKESDTVYSWQIDTKSELEDSLLGIDCIVLTLSGKGHGKTRNEAEMSLSVKVWFARCSTEMDCFQAKYYKLSNIAGFDPLELIKPGIAVLAAFGVSIKKLYSNFRLSTGLPIRVDISLTALDNDAENLLFTYLVNLERTELGDIAQNEFMVPSHFKEINDSANSGSSWKN